MGSGTFAPRLVTLFVVFLQLHNDFEPIQIDKQVSPHMPRAATDDSTSPAPSRCRHSVANIVIGKDSNEKTSSNPCNSQIFSLPLPAIVKTKINF